MRYLLALIVFTYSIFFFSCRQNEKPSSYVITKSMTDDSAMVASAHPLATKIGVDVLKKGGNAIDAAIAVQFALAVCYPVAGNIGGGGLMVYRTKEGEVYTLDFREMAPALASKDMYLDKSGNPTDQSQFGNLASGVPGSVAGMQAAFDRFSKLKNWKALLQPSIDAASQGIALTEKEAISLNEDDSIFTKVNKAKTTFNAKLWKQGDLLVQKDLAHTLEMIRDHGKDGFYKGKIADLIVAEMKKGGGIITLQDLQSYEAKWRDPIVFSYRGHKIFGMGPPSSGGICLNQLLKSVEPYDVKNMAFHSVNHIHLLAEAERRTYADRASHLGDADFYHVPIKNLCDSQYILSKMKNFNAKKASLSADIKAGKMPKESEQTTHFSIVDQEGNAVSLTTTLNGGYGSYVVVSGAGFILNNEMDDFAVKPGVPNLYGLVGAEANKIEPKKRMLSSMTPTIVEKNGKLKLVVGTPGGSTIITSVFQTIVNVLDFGMDASTAVNAPRFHHQWLPDAIHMEDHGFQDSVVNLLKTMGHKIKTRKAIGRVEAIVITDEGKLNGGADIRGDDDVKGF